ncbi:hypothetical protein AN639_06835, partial [Candidatus Epulonipiscium fishelsonii]
AGVIIVTLKNVLKILLFGSSTGFVGEFANWVVSLGYILPIMLLIKKDNSLKSVTAGVTLGVISMGIVGGLMNYYVMLDFYSAFMPMEAIIEMGHAIFSPINDKLTLVLYSMVPFNIFKGTIISITSIVLLKSLYPALRKIRIA